MAIAGLAGAAIPAHLDGARPDPAQIVVDLPPDDHGTCTGFLSFLGLATLFSSICKPLLGRQAPEPSSGS
jgi:hypothetical protein